MDKWPKLILALDVPVGEIGPLLDEVGAEVPYCKVGLNMIASGHLVEVARRMRNRNVHMFLDVKLHDIPNTVANAASSIVQLGAKLFTIHASGGREMMRAALDACAERAAELNISPTPVPVGVTVLTSMDQDTWRRLYSTYMTVEDQVLFFVEETLAAGLKAVVASPLEVKAIRSRFGDDLSIITPGIRPAWAAKGDQKRIAEPGKTLAMGATSLVIGRPILYPPEEVGSRKRAVELIAEEIGGL